MAAGDRVMEADAVPRPSHQDQDADREWIDWMCRQVVGERVLDVGCGDAAAAILLAREGAEVVGVDSDPSAIEAAQSRLAAEEEEVRGKVEVRVAEAHTLPFDDESFDAALLGDVLALVLRKENVLNEITRVLRPGGRAVVTVPHGPSDSADTKEPVYPLELLSILADKLEPVSLQLVSDHLGVVALKTESPVGQPSPELLTRALDLTERRLREEQNRSLHRRRAHEKATEETLRLRVELDGTRLEARRADALDELVTSLAEDRRRAEDALAQETAERSRLEERVAYLEAEQETLTAASQSDAERLAINEATLETAASDLARARDELAKAQRAHAKRAEEVRRLAVEADSTAARAEGLRRRHARLEMENERLRGELERLTTRLEALQSAPSYRLLRYLWRANAVRRNLLGRARRSAGTGKPS